MPTPTTDELLATVKEKLEWYTGAALYEGGAKARKALAALEALAQRTRDLEGEVKDVAVYAGELYETNSNARGFREIRDRLRAALAQPEAGHSCNTSDLAKQDCPQCEAEAGTAEAGPTMQRCVAGVTEKCYICNLPIPRGHGMLYSPTIGNMHVYCEVKAATPEPDEAGTAEASPNPPTCIDCGGITVPRRTSPPLTYECPHCGKWYGTTTPEPAEAQARRVCNAVSEAYEWDISLTDSIAEQVRREEVLAEAIHQMRDHFGLKPAPEEEAT